MAFSNDDILVLARAGFNAQQIAALNNVTLQAGAAPAAVPSSPQQITPQTQETTPAAPVLSEPVNEQTAPVCAPTTPVNAPTAIVNTPAPAPVAPTATTDDVLKAISGINEQLRLNNLQNMQQPKPVTAEDILAEIINPPKPQPKV